MHWCNVVSEPSFVFRFLCLQGDAKQQFMRGTLINEQGEEFLNRMSSSSKPLTPLFILLMEFHHLKEEPIVVATYNDLVLCRVSRSNQRDYYICNPYTLKWVPLPLPPPPQVFKYTSVGILCDLPYYNCKKNDVGGNNIQLNAVYRCRVVRTIYQNDETPSCEFKVQIFSSDTVVWRESVVSSPSKFKLAEVGSRISFAHNGMLHWTSHSGNFLIGLDPFMMDNRKITSISGTSSSTGDGDRYKCLFTTFDGSDGLMLEGLGVYNGCLQIGDYDYDDDNVVVWELNEEACRGAGESYLEHRKRVIPLDPEMIGEEMDIVAFDPNNDGTLYVFVIGVDNEFGDIFMYNICTGKYSKIVEKHARIHNFFQVAVPLWPTPVPRLPEREVNPPLVPISP